MTITFSYPGQGYVCPSCEKFVRRNAVEIRTLDHVARQATRPVAYHAECFAADFPSALAAEDEVEQDWAHPGEHPKAAVTRPQIKDAL